MQAFACGAFWCCVVTVVTGVTVNVPVCRHLGGQLPLMPLRELFAHAPAQGGHVRVVSSEQHNPGQC